MFHVEFSTRILAGVVLFCTADRNTTASTETAKQHNDTTELNVAIILIVIRVECFP